MSQSTYESVMALILAMLVDLFQVAEFTLKLACKDVHGDADLVFCPKPGVSLDDVQRALGVKHRDGNSFAFDYHGQVVQVDELESHVNHVAFSSFSVFSMLMGLMLKPHSLKFKANGLFFSKDRFKTADDFLLCKDFKSVMEYVGLDFD